MMIAEKLVDDNEIPSSLEDCSTMKYYKLLAFIYNFQQSTIQPHLIYQHLIKILISTLWKSLILIV